MVAGEDYSPKFETDANQPPIAHKRRSLLQWFGQRSSLPLEGMAGLPRFENLEVRDQDDLYEDEHIPKSMKRTHNYVRLLKVFFKSVVVRVTVTKNHSPTSDTAAAVVASGLHTASVMDGDIPSQSEPLREAAERFIAPVKRPDNTVDAESLGSIIMRRPIAHQTELSKRRSQKPLLEAIKNQIESAEQFIEQNKQQAERPEPAKNMSQISTFDELDMVNTIKTTPQLQASGGDPLELYEMAVAKGFWTAVFIIVLLVAYQLT